MKDNNRAENGRFTAGNTAAKGNPYTRKAAAIRKALYSSVTAADIQQILSKLKEQAKNGDNKATQILFDRLLGTAQQGIDILERLERLEAAAENAKQTDNDVINLP